MMICYMGSMLVLFGQFFARKYILGKNDPSMCGVVKTNDEISWSVYRGKANLDDEGSATVIIPGFQKRHEETEGHLQLTAVARLAGAGLTLWLQLGASMPNLHVKSEVSGGRFQIAGGVAGKQVSWQLHTADQMMVAAPTKSPSLASTSPSKPKKS